MQTVEFAFIYLGYNKTDKNLQKLKPGVPVLTYPMLYDNTEVEVKYRQRKSRSQPELVNQSSANASHRPSVIHPNICSHIYVAHLSYALEFKYSVRHVI